jgi:hypothetical protein
MEAADDRNPLTVPNVAKQRKDVPAGLRAEAGCPLVSQDDARRLRWDTVIVFYRPMLFAPVSETEMQAARTITLAAAAGLVGAPLFGKWAWHIRAACLALYLVAVVGFVVYHLV